MAQLPKIDDVLRRPELSKSGVPKWALLEAARREVASRRADLLADAAASPEVCSRSVQALAEALARPSLRRVINATGVVLHTNLGRAPLARRVIDAIASQLSGYSNLEYDVAKGSRGSRHNHLRGLIRDLTGAEDAVVVNNNAAAVMLALAAIAGGREVVVSRGELVEIGGAFRIPDVCALSGASMIEVGTTNKTRVNDYATATSERTGAYLKVHHSNFAVVGFTEETSVEELAKHGATVGVPVIMDLGSGALDRRLIETISRTRSACAVQGSEPTVSEVLKEGAALVCFSCDKLLGGPQAGIIAGSHLYVERVRKHPFMRAMRPDKLTIAALAETLSIYREDHHLDQVPAVAMLTTPLETLAARANALLEALTPLLESTMTATVLETQSAVGGGSLPTTELPSFAVALKRNHPDGPSAADLDAQLRAAATPVVGRIVEDSLLLDVRTLLDDEDLAGVVRAVGERAR